MQSVQKTMRQAKRTGGAGGKAARSSLMAFALMVAGCSGNGDRVAVYPVKGTLMINGEAPEGALIVLHPVQAPAAVGEPASVEVPTPSARVKKDGSFQVTTYEAEDGAPKGQYVAAIQWNKLVKRGGDYAPGPNAAPKAYGSRDTSPWKITVDESATELQPIAIQNDGKK